MTSHLGAEPFFNRERELAQLEAAWASPRAQLITLWGRRRVGKSALLSRLSRGKRVVYLYGTRMAERDMLEAVALQMAEALDRPSLRAAPFASWRAALDYLYLSVSESTSERVLFIIDELPYLCEVTPGLDTLIQQWWDRLHRPSQWMVVLAGSTLSLMEGLTSATGALHGRRTAQVEVLPFDYLDAAHFFPHLSAEDRVRAYACFGGMPAYLQHWEPARALGPMLEATLLSPGHFLFREGAELLGTEFHQEALYASILRAAAAGPQRASEIARAVGRRGANEILDHLRRLQDLQLLRREVPPTELHRPRSQRVLYRLADPYLRFWFRYVSPYQSFLQLEKGRDVWEREIQPTLDQFVAQTAWEEVCAQNLWRRLAGDEFPAPFAQLGRWWDGKDEIDLVGLWAGAATVVGECKWTSSPVDERVFVDLQRKAQKLPLAQRPLWVLASRSGFHPVLRQRAQHGDLLLLEPADLFASPLLPPGDRRSIETPAPIPGLRGGGRPGGEDGGGRRPGRSRAPG